MRISGIMKKIAIFLVTLVLAGCLGMPDNVEPIKNFDVSRYLGRWYEIARLDHSFERGLVRVTANYSLREDGGISVVNRGYSAEKNQWKEADGKAYFVNEKDIGYLKVSFFGPFYGSYVIFEIDRENYEYAFISGPDLSYLWLLSRKPNLSQKVIEEFRERAKELGFDVNELIIVSHDENA